MIQILLSVCVLVLAGWIYMRYGGIFSLPFFWAAFFVFQYLGLVQVSNRFGGDTYFYASVAFGVFFLGLLASDFLFGRPRGERRQAGNASQPKGSHPSVSGRSRPLRQPTRVALPFPSLVLILGITSAMMISAIVSLMFFSTRDIPILSSAPSFAWVASTSGVIGRLMTAFGVASFPSLAVAAYGVARFRRLRWAWALCTIALLCALIGGGLLSSKADAIVLYLWFNMIVFYLNKRTRWTEVILPLLLVVIPVSITIVALRQTSSAGSWRAQDIWETYYVRVTTVAAEPVDFTLNYMKRFGELHGGALMLEVERIKDQVTGKPKSPLMSEFVGNLITGTPDRSTTGISTAVTFYATGFLEFGLVGMFVYSFVQGLAFGWVHHRLLSKKSLSLFGLLVWGGVFKALIAISVGGALLMGLEGAVLEVAPPLFLISFFSFIIALTIGRGSRFVIPTQYANALRRRDRSADRVSPYYQAGKL